MAIENGRLENMKWLLENKFPYSEKVFEIAIKKDNIYIMKWLLQNKFPYSDNTKKKLIEYNLLKEK